MPSNSWATKERYWSANCLLYFTLQVVLKGDLSKDGQTNYIEWIVNGHSHRLAEVAICCWNPASLDPAARQKKSSWVSRVPHVTAKVDLIVLSQEVWRIPRSLTFEVTWGLASLVQICLSPDWAEVAKGPSMLSLRWVGRHCIWPARHIPGSS